MNLQRRELSAGLVAALAGCGRLRTRTCSDADLPDGTPQGRFTDLTGDHLPDGRIGNRRISVRLDSEHLDGLALLSRGERRSSGVATGPIETRPNRPTSLTTGDLPVHEATRTFTVGSASSSAQYYRADRLYRLSGSPFGIDVRATIHGGDPFVLLEVVMTNRDASRMELDHDTGNIHDGISLFSGVHLLRNQHSTGRYRFAIPTHGTRVFANQPKWKTFRHSDWATVFDEDDAVTSGLLHGDTAPKMWITEGNSLGYLVNETVLSPGESTSYLAFLGFHEGGDDAPAEGEQLFCAARRRARRLDGRSLG